MRVSPILLAVGSAVIVATSALAATVTSEQGEVFVNQGDGFKAVTQPMDVSAGGQVMVKPKSSGRVVFADGCTVKVAPGTVFTVSAKSPCERSGRHIETSASSPPGEPPPQDGNDAALFLSVVGVPVGMALLPGKDRAASP